MTEAEAPRPYAETLRVSLALPAALRLSGARLVTGSVVLGTLAAFTAAELVTTYINLITGMALHAIILSALILAASLRGEDVKPDRSPPMSRLLYSLTLVPLIRILSLSMPLTRFDQPYWYLMAGLPVFVAALVVMFALDLRPRQLGLRLGRPALHLPLAALGFGLGITEYHILRPDPLIGELTLAQFILPALVLMFATGFLEEFLFRGILQATAKAALGWAAIIYVSLVFAILHIGYRSALDIAFVFAIALVYGWAARKTGSIMGVSVSHGITNITLFLVVPFIPALSARPDWLTFL